MNTNTEPVIRIEGLTKHFDTTRALSDVDLTVGRGEIVVLLGLSGSGKSTLLRHIDALELPTAGTVGVLGENVPALRGRRLRQLRSRVGFIFQQFELVGSLTVLENVLTGALSALRGPRLGLWSYSRADRLRALGHLDRVGLLDRAYQRADTLSGGQQQRVAIARALMLEPKVLLLDEPTSALDVSVQAEILNLLKRLRREQNLTYLMVTHNLPVVSFLCDRLAVMRHGRIVEVADVAQLKAGQLNEPYSMELLAATEGG